jgi:hypothetical protein
VLLLFFSNLSIFLKGIVKKQKVKYNEKENERKGGKNK